MKKDKYKKLILEQLKKSPVVQIGCNQVGISRATYYRWISQDKKFKKAANEAIREGELLINDLSESQEISLIKDKNWPAIRFWLKHHHPKYANRIEVDAKIKQLDDKLSPEQEKLVRKALKFISCSDQESSNNKSEKTTKKTN